MTESEWLTCTDPQAMPRFLKGKVSDRKLRLFAVGCCGQIRDLMADEKCARCVQVSEQFADGLITRQALVAMMKSIAPLARRSGYGSPQALARDVALVNPRDAAHCVSVQ